MSFYLISNCRYLLLASNVMETVASLNKSIHSFIRGIGYESRVNTVLSLRYSTHSRIVSFFMGTNTMGVSPIDLF